MAGHVVKVSVVADTKKFSRAFRGLAKETGLSSLADAGKAAIGVLARVGAAAGAALGAVSLKAVAAAADLEQSTGSIEAVFKGAADQMKKFASQAADTVGLTKNEYQELGTLIGAQLKNAGTPMDQLAGKTNDLIGLGADMAAMFGGTTADAVGALSSALKGERDPIERYGVSLKQASIDAKAAEMGFTKVGGSFDQEAQAAATLALIMEQTSDAHGAFARESDTLAHQVQVFKAKVGDLAAEFGTALLPYATQAMTVLNERFGPAVESVKAWLTDSAIPAVKRFADMLRTTLGPHVKAAADTFKNEILPALQEVIEWIGNKAPPAFQTLASFIKNFGPAIAAASAVLAAFIAGWKAFAKVRTIITLVRTAVIALNAVMAANPIGLIVVAIAALVAGLVYAYQHSERFREIVQTAWQAIQDAASAVVDWFTTNALPVLQQVWEGIQTAASVVSEWFTGTFLPAWSSLWDAVTAYASAVWDRLKQVWDTVGAPIATLIISIWQGVAANWSAIWDGISTYVSGAWQVISTVVTTAINVVRGVIQAVTAVIHGDWSGAWEAIKGVASSVWAGIQGVVSGAINMVQGAISTALAVIRGIWSGAWNGLRSVLSGAWNGIRSAVTSGISSVVSTVRGLPGQAASALGNIGSTLLNAGKNLIQGFINGITSKISGVKDTLSNLTSKLTSWKGPEDLDRRLLTPAGRLIIDGLIRGLESRYGAVRASLRGLTSEIAGTDMPALGVPGLSLSGLDTSAAGQRGGDMHVIIQVQALTPTPEVGRIIAQALEDWQRRNGGSRGVVVA